VRIDVHSHLVYLPYLEYLAGRSSLPQGVLRGGTCGSAGCHSAGHGSNFSPRLLY